MLMWKKRLKVIFWVALGLFLIIPSLTLAVDNNLFEEYLPSNNTDGVVFEVVDELTDIADLGNGEKRMKIYSSPREIYTDENGKKQVRPEGWNKFDEDPKTRVKIKQDAGYEFEIFITETQKVLVSSSDVKKISNDKESEYDLAKKTSLKKEKNKDKHAVTNLEDVYEDVDINFIDKTKTRTKEIMIKKVPKNIKAGDSLVYWEEYTIPENAKIMVGDNEYQNETKTFSPLQIVLDSGESMLIGSSIIYDSKFNDESFCDMSQKPVEEIVKYDKNTNILQIGLVVEADYLLDKNIIYPVIIDPSYRT